MFFTSARPRIPRIAANNMRGVGSASPVEPVATCHTTSAVPPGAVQPCIGPHYGFDTCGSCSAPSFIRNVNLMKVKPQVRDVTVGAAVAVTSVALTLGIVSFTHHNDAAATVSTPPVRTASTSITHTDECPGSGSALLRAPGPPDDPYRVVGHNWPQGDSCQLLEEMLAVDNTEIGFPTWQLPAALKNARWAADELVQHAGGLLSVTIPDNMGASTETVERTLTEASRAIRDTKERITGIVATVNATMRTGEPDASPSTVSLLLGGQRERIAAARKQLDAELRKIGSVVRDHLIPGGAPAQETYLVWNEQGVTNVVDHDGYALDSNTNARLSDVPFVTLPPVEPLKQPSHPGRT